MRSLFPLAVPFAVSIALAAALQASLIHDAPVELAPSPALTSATMIVLLTTSERRVECPTRKDLVAADVLELNPEDLPAVAAALCE